METLKLHTTLTHLLRDSFKEDKVATANNKIAGIEESKTYNPEHVHRTSLQRLQELGISPISLTKTKFDISEDCTNEIICALRDVFYSTHDESSKTTLIDELERYRNRLATIEDSPHYPNSMDIRDELGRLIQK